MTSSATGPTPRFAALRRTLAAPGLVLAVGLLHLAIAAAAAAPVRAAFRAAMTPFFHEDPHRLFAPLLEMLAVQRAAPAALAASVIVGAAVAAVLGPLLSGAAIRRLSGPCPASEQARAAVALWPSAIVIGLYGVVLRLLLLLVAAALGGVHPLALTLLIVLALTFATATVDLARAHVLLAGARPFHPRTFVRAAGTVAQDPRLWLRSAALSLLGVAVSAAILLVTIHGLASAWAPWAARGLGLLATFVALWRLAVATEYTVSRG